MSTCPICGLDASIRDESDAFGFVCDRCGNFRISSTEGFIIETIRTQGVQPESEHHNDWLLLQFLPAYTRQQSERGDTAMLDSENWRDYAHKHSKTPAAKKKAMLLNFIAANVEYIGHQIRFDCNLDYPLINACSTIECNNRLCDLEKDGYIETIFETRCSHLVSFTVKGEEYLEEISRQVFIIGEMDYDAVPAASRQDLMKAADRYKSGDLSGALAAACGAVDSACVRVFKDKGLGDPTKVGFQQKVIQALRANGSLKKLETELVSIGWDGSDARQLRENLKEFLSRAALVMQTLRSKMSDAHGSKAVLEPVVFDSLKWAAIIAVQLR